MKIVDKMRKATEEGTKFYSFEFFPPRTDEGVENLFIRQDRMAGLNPTFCDITWGAGGTTADLTMQIATKMQNTICVETMMHLTCTNMPQEELKKALDQAKAAGIQNILALRGDPPKGEENFTAVEGGFSCALDLVKYIRANYDDFFGIAVAGYPEAHPDRIVSDAEEMKKNYWADIHYLKEKMDAGADLVVTQLFYDVERFIQYEKDCRSVGIDAPIIPGIMPITTYGGFKRMTGFCKTQVPPEIEKQLEAVKDDDEETKKLGVKLGTDMCKRLLEAGAPGLHLYTLNLERASVSILENLGMLKGRVEQPLPWRAPPIHKRSTESVRPIFWSNRPKSYISRTKDWEAFPSGRWGNAQSPAYGTLSDYQFMRRHSTNAKHLEKARQQWGKSLSSVEDVISVFVNYTSGTIDMLPWNEMETLQLETAMIKQELVQMNQQGYLTINSQPAVNGAPSTDSKFGWGGPNGYVYQKAYVEFFCSPESFSKLQSRLQGRKTLTYMAVNAAGDVKSNVAHNQVNAVTWGVFPAKEVVQPTVVDPQSFSVWKDEALEVWGEEWGTIYEEGSASRKLLKDIENTWFLVSLVENDYIRGDLFGVFQLPKVANGNHA